MADQKNTQNDKSQNNQKGKDKADLPETGIDQDEQGNPASADTEYTDKHNNVGAVNRGTRTQTEAESKAHATKENPADKEKVPAGTPQVDKKK